MHDSINCWPWTKWTSLSVPGCIVSWRCEQQHMKRPLLKLNTQQVICPHSFHSLFTDRSLREKKTRWVSAAPALHGQQSIHYQDLKWGGKHQNSSVNMRLVGKYGGWEGTNQDGRLRLHGVAQFGGVLGVVLAVDQHQRIPLVVLNDLRDAAEILKNKWE